MEPLNNPVYVALCALAPPEDWAAVTRVTQTRLNRLRVLLRLHHTEAVHTLEMKLRDEKNVEEVWAAFNRWFAAFTSVGLETGSEST
ncbi:MAG: hypothetical protein ABIZ04_15305 [Opitutus sp.]